MITINNLSHESPYQVFKEKYDEAINANQKNIEAICIASYSRNKKEVNSRYVNLKFLDSKEFIFFSNYNSIKAQDFISHNQITGIFFWNSINVQIRMKGLIKKTFKGPSFWFFLGSLARASWRSCWLFPFWPLKHKFPRGPPTWAGSSCPSRGGPLLRTHPPPDMGAMPAWGGGFFHATSEKPGPPPHGQDLPARREGGTCIKAF